MAAFHVVNVPVVPSGKLIKYLPFFPLSVCSGSNIEGGIGISDGDVCATSGINSPFDNIISKNKAACNCITFSKLLKYLRFN